MTAKYHRINSALLSIIFLVVVQLFATPNPIFRYLVPAIVVYAAVFGIYNWIYLNSIEKMNWWVWLRPLLFVASWFGLFFILPSEFLRGAFLLAGLPILYFIEALVSGVGQQVLFNEVLLTAFGFFMTAAAVIQYYPSFGVGYSIIVFVLTAALCRASFEFTPLLPAHKLSSSLVIALFCTELFWALNFLPLHYSVLAMILFNAFYFCWALYYYSIFKHLTAKRVQFHLVLALLFIAVIVIASPWKIIT